jgi:hypothetical protein
MEWQMNTENQNQPERVRDAATIAKLKDLSQKLFSDDINKARLAAHELSWMQEDGFTLLKLGLFGRYSRNTKKAAAYGLRNMKGRMRKMAVELLTEGLKDRDRTSKAACKKALQLMGILPKDAPRSQRPRPQRPSGNRRVQELPASKTAKPYTPRPTPPGRP